MISIESAVTAFVLHGIIKKIDKIKNKNLFKCTLNTDEKIACIFVASLINWNSLFE
jgi:hypothetical protein